MGRWIVLTRAHDDVGVNVQCNNICYIVPYNNSGEGPTIVQFIGDENNYMLVKESDIAIMAIIQANKILEILESE